MAVWGGRTGQRTVEFGTMSEPSNQSEPNYVVCHCQHCDGQIEFDANEFSEANSILPCPHCGLETKIAIPIAAPIIQEHTASAIPAASVSQTVAYPLESDNSPRFVTCYCEHCFDEIRFDANSLIVIGKQIPCPHCGLQTGIFAPQPSGSDRDEVQPVHFSPNLQSGQIFQRSNEEPKIIPAVTTTNSKMPNEFRHKRVRIAKGTRIALSPKQCASPLGKELVDLLLDVVKDGIVPYEEMRRLNDWLAKNSESEISAIKFLLQISDRILRTGKLTTARAVEMHSAIVRVLPTDMLGQVEEARKEAWVHSPLKRKATDRQLKYIRVLGGTAPLGINISEASLLINELLGKPTSQSKHSTTENQLEHISAVGGNSPEEITPVVADAQMNANHFIIVELQQGSNEWREWRHNGIGASDASTIMGENRFKSASQLLNEKRGPAQDYGQNAAMARGTELEPEARRLYIEKTGKAVRPICLQSTRYDWLRASLDGFAINHDAVVEIKCGQSAYRTAFQTGSVPDYYYGQMQHILAVTGLDSLDFWCYWPGCPALLIPVQRNESYIQRLLEKELEFWNLVRQT